MPVYHDHSLIYVHIPRTAGVTLHTPLGIKEQTERLGSTTTLFGYHNQLELDHLTMDLISTLDWIDYESIKNFTKVSIVRNPYDRMVSEYHYKRKHNDARFVDAQDISFEVFVKKVFERFREGTNFPQADCAHFIPQVAFVYSSSGKLLVDYIGKYEELSDAFGVINALTGTTNLDAGALQTFATDHEDFQSYYNEELEDLIYRLYRPDFEQFSYERLTFD